MSDTWGYVLVFSVLVITVLASAAYLVLTAAWARWQEWRLDRAIARYNQAARKAEWKWMQ